MAEFICKRCGCKVYAMNFEPPAGRHYCLGCTIIGQFTDPVEKAKVQEALDPVVKTVTVYRLWQDGTWDTTEVEISTHEPLSFATVELRAAERAWLAITRSGGPNPVQIGIYMPSYDTLGLPV